MKKDIKVLLGIVGGVILLLLIFIIYIYSTSQTAFTVNNLPANTKFAVPHHGAYSCESVGTGNPSYTLTSSSITISKNTIGVYTDQVNNIVFKNVQGISVYLNLFGGIRAYFSVCDSLGNNCKEYYQDILEINQGENVPLPLNAFNPLQQSLTITIKSRRTALSSWEANSEIAQKFILSYTYTKYGLKYISTTLNPAGSLFNGCESSCDLTCPEQKSRGDIGLIYTQENSLLPTESVPVLEYWESLDINLNSEMGATIYDSSRNEFCFGGAIYSASTITLDNGNSYIYPNTATRKIVKCCNGAVISTLQQDSTCINNQWIIITKDTVLQCNSDFNCPGQGQQTCNNKIANGYHCINNKCIKGTGFQVDCCSQADCPTDQTCQKNKCVGGNIIPPINVGGNKTILPEDTKCLWYQEPITTINKEYGFLWWRAITNKVKETSTTTCKTANYIYYLIIVGGIVIIVLGLSLINKPQRNNSGYNYRRKNINRRRR